MDVTRKLIAHNAPSPLAGARPGVLRHGGENALYAGAAGIPSRLEPTYVQHTFPLRFHLWRDLFLEGARCVTPSVRHLPPECLTSKIKHRNRLHMWIGEQEAHLADPRAVALFQDIHGNLSETGGANIVVYRDGKVVSPRRSNILWGVSLTVLTEILRDRGIPFAEDDLQVVDLQNAEEAWLVTTPYCMAPVVRINGVPIGDGAPDRIPRSLLEAWSARGGQGRVPRDRRGDRVAVREVDAARHRAISSDERGGVALSSPGWSGFGLEGLQPSLTLDGRDLEPRAAAVRAAGEKRSIEYRFDGDVRLTLSVEPAALGSGAFVVRPVLELKRGSAATLNRLRLLSSLPNGKAAFGKEPRRVRVLLEQGYSARVAPLLGSSRRPRRGLRAEHGTEAAVGLLGDVLGRLRQGGAPGVPRGLPELRALPGTCRHHGGPFRPDRALGALVRRRGHADERRRRHPT